MSSSSGVILITVGCWINDSAGKYVELNHSESYTELLFRKHPMTFKVYETLILHHLWAVSL